MTNREKIIAFLADHGIDILPYEIKDPDTQRRYGKPGTILIRKWYHPHEDIWLAVDALCDFNNPIDICTPYYKDIYGNTEYFKRDHCYARISWNEKRCKLYVE